MHDLISSASAAYQAASTADLYANALHHARLVQQFEALAALSQDAGAANYYRDASMAENIMWIRQREGPNARIVLWAHNDHINVVPGLMGGLLRAAYGSDYVTLGFAFGQGTLTAVSGTGIIQTFKAELVPKGSIEELFLATGKSTLLVDMRTIAAGGAAAAPVGAPIRMRSVGSTFNPDSESAFFRLRAFPIDFELLLFVATGTESTRLPFVQ